MSSTSIFQPQKQKEILNMISGLLEMIMEKFCIKNKDTELVGGVLAVSVVILSLFWYLWTSMKSSKGKAVLPPGPRGLPIAGYLPFLHTDLHKQFTELANHYGPIYKLWLGNKLCIVLSSPLLIKEVVCNQGTIFANRDPPIAASIVSYGGLDIAWTPYGSYWRNMRKLFVQQMLSNNNLNATCKFRRDEVRKTIRDVYDKIGSPVDIGKLIFQTELNVIFSMLWGSSRKANDFGAVLREAISEMMKLMGKPNISDFFPMLARFDIQGVERETKRIVLLVDGILDTMIEEHMKMETTAKTEEGFNNKDFLQILLEFNKQEDDETPVNMTQVKGILLAVIIGGIDTTVTMLEWAMAEIMHHPEVLKRAQDELTEVVGMNCIFEESHLPKLQYLEAIIKETLRLHPPLPLLVPRRPSEPCILGGYSIPKDTKIFLNVWSLHKDPQFWENPYEFKPERFLSDQSTYDFSGLNYHYLPFGSGRRICPGIPLAEKMAMHILASLLHSFEWHLPKGETVDFSEEFGIVLKKKKALVAIPSPRLSTPELYE